MFKFDFECKRTCVGKSSIVRIDFWTNYVLEIFRLLISLTDHFMHSTHSGSNRSDVLLLPLLVHTFICLSIIALGTDKLYIFLLWLEHRVDECVFEVQSTVPGWSPAIFE